MIVRGMGGFTQAVLKYRWELWLFVGVPLVANVVWVIESSRPELFTLPLSERQDLSYISPSDLTPKLVSLASRVQP